MHSIIHSIKGQLEHSSEKVFDPYLEVTGLDGGNKLWEKS